MTRYRMELTSGGVALLIALVGLSPAGCREPEPEGPDEGDAVATADLDIACAKITSCGQVGSDAVSDCATEAMARPAGGTRFTPELLACLEAAGSDCAAINACTPAPSDNPCEGLGQTSFCNGSVLISCFGDRIEFAADCTTWDLSCEVIEGEGMCQGDGRSCIAGRESCDEDTAVLCVGYIEAEFNCAALVEDHVCVEESGTVQCLPEAIDCDPLRAPGACEGSEIVFCSADGGTARVDCRDLGFDGCDDTGDRAMCTSGGE